MEHPVAPDDHIGILEHQVAVSERPEVRLSPAGDDRHDVDRHLVDEPSDTACPPTSPAPIPISPSPASSCARAIPSSTEVAKRYGASGCEPSGRGRCDTTTTWSLAGG